MNKKHAIFAAAFGVLLAGCSDVEVANVETSSQNVIGFNVIGEYRGDKGYSYKFL